MTKTQRNDSPDLATALAKHNQLKTDGVVRRAKARQGAADNIEVTKTAVLALRHKHSAGAKTALKDLQPLQDKIKAAKDRAGSKLQKH